MTDKERRDVIAFCASFLKGRVPLIAGAGSNDTARALEHCLAAQNSGADALLVSTPYYNKTTQAGLVKHFTFLADRVSIPVILYNVPSRTGMTIEPETYRILSKHPNIVGAKDASGSAALWEDILRSCEPGFHLWSGNDSETVPLMALGGSGVISVLSNIVPERVAAMKH